MQTVVKTHSNKKLPNFLPWTSRAETGYGQNAWRRMNVMEFAAHVAGDGRTFRELFPLYERWEQDPYTEGFFRTCMSQYYREPEAEWYRWSKHREPKSATQRSQEHRDRNPYLGGAQKQGSEHIIRTTVAAMQRLLTGRNLDKKTVDKILQETMEHKELRE